MQVEKTRILRDESTAVGREVWQAVDRAANQAPDWMKSHVKGFLETTGAIPRYQVLRKTAPMDISDI